MLSSYIVDDEFHAIELLSDYINQTPGLKLNGSSLNAIEALHELSNHLPDILFLDIDMPYLSGLELFKLIDSRVQVVFTTAHANYAVDSYNLNASDFLLKPIRYERFVNCFNRIVDNLAQKTSPVGSSSNIDYIYIQSGLKSKIIKIIFDDILYIESLNNYLVIYLLHEKHIVYLSLKEILERLPEAQFSRIHKSFIINYTKIRVIEGNRVFVSSHLPPFNIGAQFKEKFFEKVEKQLLRKVKE